MKIHNDLSIVAGGEYKEGSDSPSAVSLPPPGHRRCKVAEGGTGPIGKIEEMPLKEIEPADYHPVNGHHGSEEHIQHARADGEKAAKIRAAARRQAARFCAV